MVGNQFLDKNCSREEYPVELEGTLDLQNAEINCCKFNRFGSLVALGSTDGRVFIVDFITRSVAMQLSYIGDPLTTLSWSRDGRFLVTGSTARACAVWNVETGKSLGKRFYFAGSILDAQFNPRNNDQFLVLPVGLKPSLVEVQSKTSREINFSNKLLRGDHVTCVCYSRRGDYIFIGTLKGHIVIYNVRNLECISIVKQNCSQQVVSIVVPRKGSFILTNTQDKQIRRYDLDELMMSGTMGKTVEPLQMLGDAVSKAAWNGVCCSPNGVYICGASNQALTLHIWDLATGHLVTMLHGAKSHGVAMHTVQWHPKKAVILSVAEGVVSVWTRAQLENWSAFAPDFTELEANSVHVEKESEFDEFDEDASEDEKEQEEGSEDVEIDVLNLDADDLGCSSDEEGLLVPARPGTGPLFFIPITPSIDQPEWTLPSTSTSPYADRTFLRQPAGGMPMTYDDPNDVRLRMIESMQSAAATSKPVVKVPRRRARKD